MEEAVDEKFRRRCRLMGREDIKEQEKKDGGGGGGRKEEQIK